MKISAWTEEQGDFLGLPMCEEFFAAAKDFVAMQEEHEGALLAENYKDLMAWPQSRERAFRKFARICDGLVACGLNKKVVGTHVLRVMQKILDKEAVLQRIVLSLQLKRQEQLLAMRKGKEVLQGYNINKGMVPRPRYFSNKM